MEDLDQELRDKLFEIVKGSYVSPGGLDYFLLHTGLFGAGLENYKEFIRLINRFPGYFELLVTEELKDQLLIEYEISKIAKI